MANIKSQIKRNRTNEEARKRNASKKSAVRTAMKKVRLAVEAKDLAKAEEALRLLSVSSTKQSVMAFNIKTLLLDKKVNYNV